MEDRNGKMEDRKCAKLAKPKSLLGSIMSNLWLTSGIFLLASYIFSQASNSIYFDENAQKISSINTFVECYHAPEHAEDRRLNKSRVIVSTFNTNFLFFKSFGRLKCPGKNCKWKTIDQSYVHLQSVAKIIKEMNADILQLTEVEDCDGLRLLTQALAAIGDSTYRPYLIQGRDYYTGQNVGLLTRIDPIENLKLSKLKVQYPIPNSNCGKKVKSRKRKTVSKNFVARFHIQGMANNISLIGLHFLARPTSKSRCAQREAQAMVIHNLIAQQQLKYKEDEVIVLGDINDWSSTTVDANNHLPISKVHNILESSGGGLKNVATKVDKAYRFTNWYDKDRDCKYEKHEVSQLDHIFLSAGLYEKIEKTVFGNKLFLPSCSSTNSDHFPLSVILTSI